MAGERNDVNLVRSEQQGKDTVLVSKYGLSQQHMTPILKGSKYYEEFKEYPVIFP